MTKPQISTTLFSIILIAFLGITCKNTNHHSQSNSEKIIQGVPFTDVKLEDNFWKPRIDINRKVFAGDPAVINISLKKSKFSKTDFVSITKKILNIKEEI